MTPDKNKLSEIILALISDIKTRTSNLPVVNYDPDDLVGRFPELKLRFIGSNFMYINQNSVLSKGIINFQLMLTNQLLNTDNTATTIEAMLKVSQIVNQYQASTPTIPVNTLAISGIKKIIYTVRDNNIYQSNGLDYIKVYDLELTIEN